LRAFAGRRDAAKRIQAGADAVGQEGGTGMSRIIVCAIAQIGLFLFGRDCICGPVSMFPIGGSIMETGYLYAPKVALTRDLLRSQATLFIKMY